MGDALCFRSVTFGSYLAYNQDGGLELHPKQDQFTQFITAPSESSHSGRTAIKTSQGDWVAGGAAGRRKRAFTTSSSRSPYHFTLRHRKDGTVYFKVHDGVYLSIDSQGCVGATEWKTKREFFFQEITRKSSRPKAPPMQPMGLSMGQPIGPSTRQPTVQPMGLPTAQPIVQPMGLLPMRQLTAQPTVQPMQPMVQPIAQPIAQPMGYHHATGLSMQAGGPWWGQPTRYTAQPTIQPIGGYGRVVHPR